MYTARVAPLIEHLKNKYKSFLSVGSGSYVSISTWGIADINFNIGSVVEQISSGQHNFCISHEERRGSKPLIHLETTSFSDEKRVELVDDLLRLRGEFSGSVEFGVLKNKKKELLYLSQNLVLELEQLVTVKI